MRRLLSLLGTAALVGLALAVPADASHSWNGYHWARTSNPFSLKLGDNVSGPWDSVLGTTSSDWSKSTVLDTTIVAGQAKGNCRPTSGRVEVCNRAYGYNGWLGVAQIWVTGGVHITQGTTKLNDSYMNSSPYNTTAWRNLVSCQEVGHTLGLDHQDENFANPNLGTCMDYTNDPSTNQHPNQHDYEELEIIYSHLDSFTTVGAAPRHGAASLDERDSWGREVARSHNGRTSVFERNLSQNTKVVTFVIWA